MNRGNKIEGGSGVSSVIVCVGLDARGFFCPGPTTAPPRPLPLCLSPGCAPSCVRGCLCMAVNQPALSSSMPALRGEIFGNPPRDHRQTRRYSAACYGVCLCLRLDARGAQDGQAPWIYTERAMTGPYRSVSLPRDAAYETVSPPSWHGGGPQKRVVV